MAGFTKSLGLIGHMWRRQYTQCATSSLRFQSAGNNLVGLLTVGAVIGTGVTITDYVIEWRLGSVTGEIVLITGTGPDPAIQAFHPIVSEPVVGGVLYAVIRYIVIDGIRYSPYFMEGQSSPDLLTCLGSVTVTTMNCGNSTGGWGYYSHTISYVNTEQPSSNAERTLRFDLNPDGSTTQFAWEFYGYEIADRLQIYYVSLGVETLLKDWVIGNNNSANDFISTPKKYKFNYLRGLIDLTTTEYFSGDYIKLKVSPSYNAPSNTDTNWRLNLKCFTTAVPFDRDFASNDTNEIDMESMTLVWDDVNCGYSLQFDTASGSASPWNEDMAKFFQLTAYYSWDWSVSQKVFLPKNTSGGAYWGKYFAGQILSAGQITISKVGPVLKYQFDNVSDYNHYKDGYDITIADSHWVDWTADAASILHYKFFWNQEKIALGEGDTGFLKDIYISRHSAITFDDITYTITIDVLGEVNEFVDLPCSNTHETIDQWINIITTWSNTADFSCITKYRPQYPFSYVYFAEVPSIVNVVECGPFGAIPEGAFDNAFSLNPQWSLNPVYGWVFIKFYIKVEITDPSDPLNNYRVYSKVKSDGSFDTVWTLIKTVP